LIDLAYTSDNRIEYSEEMLARYTNSDVETVEKILKLKGVKKGDFWTIPSCDKRIELANKNRKNGIKGGRPKTQNKPKQNPNKTQSVTIGETQTERQIEIEREIESKYNTPTSYYNPDEDVEKTKTKPLDFSKIGKFPVMELKERLSNHQTWFDQVGMKNSIEPE